MPHYKKESKLKSSNYRPIFLLSNIDKALERLMYNRLYNFLELNIVLFTIYNLVLDKNIQHPML